jgi:hypothetical protein
MDDNTFQQARQFYEDNKHLTGKLIREKFLTLPPEQMYDYLDVLHGDMIHEWRQSLFASENENKRLTEKLNNVPHITQA